MTQGKQMPPTILNVVVDVVVRHWVHRAVEEVEARGETGWEGRHKAALFYANDGTVALSDPAWIQGAFNSLVGLFERVGPQKMPGRLSAWCATPASQGET